jgi:hypothetical protein
MATLIPRQLTQEQLGYSPSGYLPDASLDYYTNLFFPTDGNITPGQVLPSEMDYAFYSPESRNTQNAINDINAMSGLYGSVAGGTSLQDFNSLFSPVSNAISVNDFNSFSPEVQAWAKQHPQEFIKDVLAHKNSKTGDLVSPGVEGGYKNLGAVTVGPNGLDYSNAGYIQPKDDPWYETNEGLALASAGVLGGLAAWPTLSGAAGAAPTSGSSWGSLVGGGLNPSAGGITGLTGAGGLGFTTAGASAEALGALGPGFFAAETLGGAGGLAGLTGAGGGVAGAGTSGGGMLGTGLTPSQLASGAKTLGGLTGAVGSSSAGGGGGTDWGSLIGTGGNAALQNYLSNQQVDNAAKLAESIKFTPYNISSGMGRTYVDPATGEMKSELAPEWQNAQNALMGSFYGNMQQANMDPMQASQYAYNMGSQLNAYQDEQNRLGLENRLLSQGMLGSTGGGTQMRSLYDSMNQRDLAREAQSLNLGQDMLNQYQNRALAAYNPAWNTQTQFANQVNQSGSLGGQALQGQMAGANLMNNAYLNRNDMLSQGGQNFFGSPAFSGQNGLLNQGANWLSGSLGGTSSPGWDTGYNSAINQQDGFNWSGQEGVIAGSDQDMMLNDQWNWGW